MFILQYFNVWMEILVIDLDKVIDFYNVVFKMELKFVMDMGFNFFVMFLVIEDVIGVVGYFYFGKLVLKGIGLIIYFVCLDMFEEIMEWFVVNGGEILFDLIVIFVGCFVYGIDLDGNFIFMFVVSFQGFCVMRCVDCLFQIVQYLCGGWFVWVC